MTQSPIPPIASAEELSEQPIRENFIENLPVIAWQFGKSPGENCDLTPHAPAQAQINALRIENESLRRLLALAEAQDELFASAKARRAALKAGKDHGHE